MHYPPVSFHFRVEFQGLPGLKNQDAFFQEVTGLSRDLETEQLREGGRNDVTHQLPTRTKYPNLVLKRGLFVDSGLGSWVNDAMEHLDIKPCTVLVQLLNENHTPLLTYRCEGAYPLKWSIDGFNAQDSKILVETMELYYQHFKIMP